MLFLFLAILYCAVFNGSDDSKHPCLVSDLSEKGFFYTLTFRLWKITLEFSLVYTWLVPRMSFQFGNIFQFDMAVMVYTLGARLIGSVLHFREKELMFIIRPWLFILTLWRRFCLFHFTEGSCGCTGEQEFKKNVLDPKLRLFLLFLVPWKNIECLIPRLSKYLS